MRRGFTLVEIVIALTLFSIVLAMGAGLSFPYYRRQQVVTAARVVASELRQAQAEAESQWDDSAHGIKVAADSVVRFTGNSHATRTVSKDRTSLFSVPVTVSGTTEFVFPKGNITPQTAGTLTLTTDDLAIDLTSLLMAFSRLRAGQSLLEALIAVAILAMMATGSFALVGVTIAESQIAAEQADARNLAEEGLEAARQTRNEDFALLTAGTHGLSLTGSTWTFAGASDTTDQFSRAVTITQIDENQRDVHVAVTWEARPGRTLTYTESTRFANWVNAPIPAASNCKSEGSTSGDWTNPVVLGSADLGAGNAGTDVVVKWPHVFMSGTAASSAKPDLFVFDATNPASPALLTSLDTGADGINSLFLLGNYLYAASANNSKELMVFDVSTPASPTLIGSSDLPGSEDGLTILAAETWVALGRANATAAEVYLYDVSTPAIPSLVDSFEVGADVNDLTTNGQILFAATSSATKDVYMVSLEDPLDPTELGSANLASATADTTIAYHDPGTLFVGNASNQLTVYSASAAPTLTLQSSYNTQGTVQDILCVIDNLIYTGTNYSTKEFQILNIADLEALTEYGSVNFPQVATGVDFYNNMVFVSVRSNDALRILTSTP